MENDSNKTMSESQGYNRDRGQQNPEKESTGYDEIRTYRSKKYMGWGNDYEDSNDNRFSIPGKFRSNNIINISGSCNYSRGGNETHNDDQARDDFRSDSHRANNSNSNTFSSYYKSSSYGKQSADTGNVGYNSPYNGNGRDWWSRTVDKVSSWFGNGAAQRRLHMDKMNDFHHNKGRKGSFPLR